MANVVKETRIDGEVHGYGSLPGSMHAEFTGTTNMVSFDHHRYSHPPHYRSGGAWTLKSTRHKVGSAKIHKTNGAGTAVLFSGTAVTRHATTTAAPKPLSDDALDAKGATAMARVLPTNPNAELATLLGETFKEGVPNAIGAQSLKSRANVARGAGGEYLNVQFGWLPLVSEVRALADSTKRSTEIWRKHLQDANKDIHRSYDEPDITTVSSTTGGVGGAPTGAGIIWTSTTTITRVTKSWNEFAFRYHIPMGDDFKSQMERTLAKANKLYGVSLTPEVLWNLAPWSWGVDWFTNTGDVLRNMSALQSDTLLLLYGYSMYSEVVTTSTQGTCVVNGKTYRSSLTTVETSKQRRPANPYGFGVAGMALSQSQKAIVAALAASRTGRR